MNARLLKGSNSPLRFCRAISCKPDKTHGKLSRQTSHQITQLSIFYSLKPGLATILVSPTSLLTSTNVLLAPTATNELHSSQPKLFYQPTTDERVCQLTDHDTSRHACSKTLTTPSMPWATTQQASASTTQARLEYRRCQPH